MTQCECPIAGYCKRHGIHKPDGWHRLCQSRDDYRAAWDDGHGPGQRREPQERREKPMPYWARLIASQRIDDDRGVGDTLARLASYVGGEHYKRLMEKLGRGCGCGNRQAMLNRRWPY